MATRKQTEPTNQLPAEDLPFDPDPTTPTNGKDTVAVTESSPNKAVNPAVNPEKVRQYSPHITPLHSPFSVGGIHAKLVAIQSELKNIPKSGYNQSQNYHYSNQEDIVTAVRKLCVKHEVSFYSTQLLEYTQLGNFEMQTRNGARLVRTAYVAVQITLTDINDGSFVVGTGDGYAEDTAGDKAVYKAITGACKYALRTLFNLASGEEDNDATDGAGEGSSASNFQTTRQGRNQASQSHSNGSGSGPAPSPLKQQYIEACKVRGIDPKAEYLKVQSHFAGKTFDQLAESDQRQIVECITTGGLLDRLIPSNQL